MKAVANPGTKGQYILHSAQWSCWALGAGLLVWGTTPLVVQRVASYDPPLLETLLVNSWTLLLGATFVGLSVLIGRRVNWALWGSVCLSTVLIASTMAVSIAKQGRPLPLFPLVLASCTSLTGWLAVVSHKGKTRER